RRAGVLRVRDRELAHGSGIHGHHPDAPGLPSAQEVGAWPAILRHGAHPPRLEGEGGTPPPPGPRRCSLPDGQEVEQARSPVSDLRGDRSRGEGRPSGRPPPPDPCPLPKAVRHRDLVPTIGPSTAHHHQSISGDSIAVRRGGAAPSERMGHSEAAIRVRGAPRSLRVRGARGAAEARHAPRASLECGHPPAGNSSRGPATWPTTPSTTIDGNPTIVSSVGRWPSTGFFGLAPRTTS